MDNQQLTNIVQDDVNATANAHQKYIDALEQRLMDKDAEIEKLQTLVNEMSDYFPACIDCEGKTTLGERTDKCVYEIDNTNYCTKRGIANIASIRNENRELKEEIEVLKAKYYKLCEHTEKIEYELAEKQADTSWFRDAKVSLLSPVIRKIKSEAIKEFAGKVVEERLAVVCLEGVTEEYSNGYHDALCYVEEQIDNLKKEMAGDV